MSREGEPNKTIIDICVDGTLQTVNDQDPSQPISVVGRALIHRVNHDGAHYKLLGCNHQVELPTDANRVVFYHSGLASSNGIFKDHIITTPPGTRTGATDDGQDRMAYISINLVCEYIDNVLASDPERNIAVNFFGHSRGAIVAGHMSNELGIRYKGNSRVSLIRGVAIDPVPGGSAGRLASNERKLASYREGTAPYPPVNTKIWGPVKHLNIAVATEGRRAHFKVQAPHSVATENCRRILCFDDRTDIRVTHMHTSHYDIAVYADNDSEKLPYPALLLESFLNGRDLPQFSDDQIIEATYRATSAQILQALAHRSDIVVRESPTISFFWKLANLVFTGSIDYIRPLFFRSNLSIESPLAHGQYNHSILTDAVNFIGKQCDQGYIKENIYDIARTPSHDLHRFLIDCYRRSSFYHKAFEIISATLKHHSDDNIDRLLRKDQFLCYAIDQVQKNPTHDKAMLANTGRDCAQQHCMLIQTLGLQVVIQVFKHAANKRKQQAEPAGAKHRLFRLAKEYNRLVNKQTDQTAPAATTIHP